jgi:hypothetical protein
LNKIRFGIVHVDEEVKEVLTERWQSYNPLQNVWDTSYICSLRKEADAMNHTVLSGMPREKAVTYNAIDFENGERQNSPEFSNVALTFPARLYATLAPKSCSSLTACWRTKAFPTDLLV